MRISKRTRDKAWLICAVVASAPWPMATAMVASLLGINSPAAAYLANRAWRRAWAAHGYGLLHRLQYAEAAALIAEGWSPEEES